MFDESLTEVMLAVFATCSGCCANNWNFHAITRVPNITFSTKGRDF